MKRAFTAIFATIASVYMVVTYQTPSSQASAENAGANGAQDSSTGDESWNSPDAPDSAAAYEAAQSATTTTLATSAPSKTLAAPKAKTTTTTTSAPKSTLPSRRTVQGSSVDTGYGALKVTITVEGTKITAVTATQASTDATSRSISGGAIPKLQSAALAAQSANIATVSGATKTSTGFKTSLASAIKTADI